MAQKTRLSKQRERAALLVAEDLKTDEEIAAEVGAPRRTLARWKTQPDFAARVEQIVATYREKIIAEGIANRQNRVNALNDRWRKMQQVIEERSTAYEDVAPGGETGLLCEQVTVTRTGERIESYVLDHGLLSEIRATEKQAAQELGQWEEKQHHSGELFIRRYVGVDIESV